MIELKPHQKRVVDERESLNEKLDKLEQFMKTPVFDSLDSDEQKRLCQQSIAMAGYSDFLTQRIKAFS